MTTLHPDDIARVRATFAHDPEAAHFAVAARLYAATGHNDFARLSDAAQEPWLAKAGQVLAGEVG